MRRTGADADVVFLGYGILFRQNALLRLIIEFDRSTEISGNEGELLEFRTCISMFGVTFRLECTWFDTPPGSYC